MKRPHLQATRRALDALLAQPGCAARLAPLLGLGDAAWALRGWRQTLGPHARLTLVIDAALPVGERPRKLRSAWDAHEPIPVQCRVDEGPAQAQSWATTRNASRNGRQGLVSGLLRAHADPARFYALSAGHVWGAEAGAAPGDEVEMGAGLRARLRDWTPEFSLGGISTALDAAVAQIPADILAAAALPPQALPIGTAICSAQQPLRLMDPDGIVPGVFEELVTARLALAGSGMAPYLLTEALCWRPAKPTAGGQSGGAVWNGQDQWVGMHAGGSKDGREAYAVAIHPVLAWAGASPLQRGDALAAPPRRTTTADADVRAAQPPSPADAASLGDDISILARTLWGEARGEGPQGMEAVAQVVFNRIRANSWWGRDVVSVCRKPWQFSCWNSNDPNARRLLALTLADGDFRLAVNAARRVATVEANGLRRLPDGDPTQGATHYYAPASVATPRWARGLAPCARIGRHLFFKGVA